MNFLCRGGSAQARFYTARRSIFRTVLERFAYLRFAAAKRDRQEDAMRDLLMLVLGVGFFAVTAAYVSACTRL